jgi:predicted ribosomally synthesized peptide with SipW-like signal peptide
MIRLLLSLGSIVFIAAVVASGTNAFFGDQETSTGNTFSAGAVDLKVDNESYYNGVLNPGTSWALKDLGAGDFFFNFQDLKPDDEGEDTISLHVNNNDAWACMDVNVTSNQENGCNEPEGEVDQTCGNPGDGQGELANAIHFVWWNDDGDNVLESDELDKVFYQGSYGDMSQSVALADSRGTGLLSEGPLAGQEDYYIGKAWCYGDLTLTPVKQDGAGKTGSNGPLVRGTGITCDGTGLGNETQTDSVTGDISFRAVQARNNPGFDCRGDCQINEEQTIIPDSQFEVPEVTNPKKWDIFSPAGAWNVEWRDPGPVTYQGHQRPDTAYLELHRGVVGTPYQGEQYAELDSDWDGPDGTLTGEPSSVRIYQDVSTEPGRNYEISFVWAPRPNTPASDNHLQVKWGGDVVFDSGEVADNNPGIDWIPVTIPVTATDATTRLSFTDLGDSNSLGTFIDDIQLFSEVCTLPQV